MKYQVYIAVVVVLLIVYIVAKVTYGITPY